MARAGPAAVRRTARVCSGAARRGQRASLESGPFQLRPQDPEGPAVRARSRSSSVSGAGSRNTTRAGTASMAWCTRHSR